MKIACAVVVLAVAACGRVSSNVQPAPDPSAKPLPPPPPAPPKPPADVTRTHGDIVGRIGLRNRRVVVGEPIVALVDVRSTKGPLRVFVGGDQRNQAGYPTRIALRAIDEQGVVVCDTVDAPVIPNFGGLGSERTLAEGEPFLETAVIDPMCPALTNPGDYRLILHRRLAHDGMIVKKPGSATPLSCDEYPVHEGPLPKGYEPLCASQMDALPWVTTETSLHVDPFDAGALRVATEARLKETETTTPVDETARWRIHIWVCEWVTCGCPAVSPGGTFTDADVVGALPSALPKTFPAHCPTPPP